MIERDKARKFVEDMEKLWDGLVPKALARHKSRIMGEAIDELRRLVLEGRPPVIFLVGRSGHGKSSLINALCGKTVAEVGHFKPTTSRSEAHPYHVMFNGGESSWDLVDSRGLFESTSPGGGPAEDVVELTIRDVVKHKPDVIMHVIAMPEVRALSNDLQAFERIQARVAHELGHRIPTFIVLTKPDTMGDPGEWPPEDYPEKAGLMIQVMRFLGGEVLEADLGQTISLIPDKPLHGHRLVRHPHSGAIIPVCALPSRAWNVGTLQEFIGQELPENSQLNYYQALGRKDLLRKVASRLTKRFAEIAGGIGASPLPVADILVLSPLQLLLVVMIGGLSCRPMARSTIKEYMGAVGGTTVTGFALRAAAQQLVKLMPVGGSVVSGAIAAAGTYAIGRSAEAYFFAGEVRLPKEFQSEHTPTAADDGDTLEPGIDGSA